jgi:hypothetical protein
MPGSIQKFLNASPTKIYLSKRAQESYEKFFSLRLKCPVTFQTFAMSRILLIMGDEQSITNK